MSTKRAVVVRILTLGAAVAVAFAGASRAEAGRDCVSGYVPVPFVLPDGSTHPAGDLSLCADRRLSPVQSLHRLALSGNTVGLFAAQELVAEADAVRPFLTFHRAPNGEWILVGVTLPPQGAHEHSVTARFAGPRRLAELVTERSFPTATPLEASVAGSRVLLTAQIR
jgi:hypothetical protein